MCTLTYIPSGKTPKESDLVNSCCANPHGFGYAIIAGDEIIIGKSLDYKALIQEFIKLREQYPNGDALFHSRYATHGEMTVANCHPFLVGGDNKTVLAHNGVLPVPVVDERSDTRTFAEDILPVYFKNGGLDNPVVFNALEYWSKGSKILVLTVNKAFKRSVYLLNEKDGHFDSDGIWWSNYNYKPYKKTVQPKVDKVPQYELIKDDVQWECGACFELNSDENYTDMGMCTSCNHCLWCGVYIDDCLCYHKPTKKKPKFSGAWWYDNV